MSGTFPIPGAEEGEHHGRYDKKKKNEDLDEFLLPTEMDAASRVRIVLIQACCYRYHLQFSRSLSSLSLTILTLSCQTCRKEGQGGQRQKA